MPNKVTTPITCILGFICRPAFAAANFIDFASARGLKKTVQMLIARHAAFDGSAVDLTGVLVAAAKRNATIYAADTEQRYPPDAGIESVQAAMLEWEKGKRVGQTARARDVGKAARDAYSALLADRREKALAIACPLWPRPSDELTSQEIADKAGLTVASLIRYLGPRREAQRVQKRKRK